MRNGSAKLLAVGISALALLCAQDAKKSEKKAATEASRPLPLPAPVDVASYFFASGWMGNFEEKGRKILDVNTAFSGKPRQGSTNGGLCIKITYQGRQWAGVYWQFPDGNWGDKPGRAVTGASHIKFWAAGQQGGEVVEFKSGGTGMDKRYPDTFEVTSGQVPLGRDWKPFDISLANRDLSNVVGAFACVIHGDAAKAGATVYIDAIRFE
jgi:hypothetical protein